MKLSRSPFRRRGSLALALLLTLGPPGPPAVQAQVNLPALGDAVSDDFSLGAERKLGEQIMRSIRRDPDYLEDPLLDEYLLSLWQPLVGAAEKLGNIGPESQERLAWQSFLVRDRSVNAFALPGGYVGVHLGLIAMTGTRDELASVLAHEMSHVTQRHIARGMVNAQRTTILSVAAMILGAIAASRANSADGINAAIVGSQAVAMQGQLNFSRDMEREADRIGFSVLSTAGYSPGGMAAMFEKLDAAHRLNDSNNYPYLRTHPLTTERIGEARSRLGAVRPASMWTGSTLEHAVMQARARALMDTRAETLQRLEAYDPASTAGTDADRLAGHTAAALAAGQLRDVARADAALQRAMALAAADPQATRALQLMDVQLRLDRGDVDGAADRLARWRADRSRPVEMLDGQVALALPAGAGQDALRRSAEALQTRVALSPQDASAWALLGQLEERRGQALRSLRAQAEARYAIGDLSGAVDRLKAGQRLAREARDAASADGVEASVIEARLREIEPQWRQLQLEMRQAGGR